ncbi:MAG: hypothetical protein QGI78_03750 [Phycisphaerales bacterium]|jgi:ABC-type transporter Mla subunit MlaD|nr:hypothetical protein [Phycisphaerales bacterium]
MSKLRDKQRNNVKAGIFVLSSLILGLIVITIITNLWERMTQQTTRYHASFTVEDGVGTLAVGSQVKLGGYPIGIVSLVSPSIQKDEPISTIDVYFDVDSEIQLFTNLSLEVHSGLLGSKAWLAIQDVGEGNLATPNTLLVGTASTMVGQFLGGEADADIRKTLAALRKISDAFHHDGEAIRMILGNKEADEISQAITSAKQGLHAFQDFTASFQSVWPNWESDFSNILEKSKDLPTKLDATLAETQSMVSDIRKSILPKVERSVSSIEASTKSLEATMKLVRADFPQWSGKVNEILANVQQFTARAKSAVDAISASPWRLLYRPTDREIAYEQLNDASWQLLAALHDLRQSAADLRVAVEDGHAPISDDQVNELSNSLLDSEAAFKSARDAILERMHIDFPERTIP